jgi:ribokinase
MKVVNFGSINIDIIFAVDHIVLSGETIDSFSLVRSTGGKGANQSVAFAKAGLIPIYHAGLIGEDGLWVKDEMAHYGVDVSFIKEIEMPTGQALIQLSKEGENAIVLYAGANHAFNQTWISSVLDNFSTNDWIMVQNETNELDFIFTETKKRGLKICFNPAPFTSSVLDLPLNLVDLLIVNEHEAKGISKESDYDIALNKLTSLYPSSNIILTLGKDGVMHGKKGEVITKIGTWDVPIIDTTAAGDTFIGYYLNSIIQNMSVKEALKRASIAANIAITRKGAMPSIPYQNELSLIDFYPQN